jgi:hypothetical protein
MQGKTANLSDPSSTLSKFFLTLMVIALVVSPAVTKSTKVGAVVVGAGLFLGTWGTPELQILMKPAFLGSNRFFFTVTVRDLLECKRVVDHQSYLALINTLNANFSTRYESAFGKPASHPVRFVTFQSKEQNRQEFSALEKVSNCA